MDNIEVREFLAREYRKALSKNLEAERTYDKETQEVRSNLDLDGLDKSIAYASCELRRAKTKIQGLRDLSALDVIIQRKGWEFHEEPDFVGTFEEYEEYQKQLEK